MLGNKATVVSGKICDHNKLMTFMPIELLSESPQSLSKTP